MLTARFSSAALVILIGLGASGCAEKRLNVSETCDEIQAIIAQNQAVGDDYDVAALSQDTGDRMAELAERSAEPLEKPIRVFAERFHNGDLDNPDTSDEEKTAGKQMEDSCGF